MSDVQDQINEKTIALVIKGTKITGKVLAKALLKLLAAMKNKKQKSLNPNVYHGKQSVKQLVKQGAGVTNIEITDQNIKSFERVARKYGVDFALKKDATETPPKWLVFFKARDADALTAAFKEFTAKTVKRGPKKPSLLAQLNKFKEIIKNSVVDRVKNKNRGGHER